MATTLETFTPRVITVTLQGELVYVAHTLEESLEIATARALFEAGLVHVLNGEPSHLLALLKAEVVGS